MLCLYDAIQTLLTLSATFTKVDFDSLYLGSKYNKTNFGSVPYAVIILITLMKSQGELNQYWCTYRGIFVFITRLSFSNKSAKNRRIGYRILKVHCIVIYL